MSLSFPVFRSSTQATHCIPNWNLRMRKYNLSRIKAKYYNAENRRVFRREPQRAAEIEEYVILRVELAGRN